MRIRIIKMFYCSDKGHYHAGDVVDVADTEAQEYINKGLAMQDKSMEPTETKEKPPATKIVRRKKK